MKNSVIYQCLRKNLAIQMLMPLALLLVFALCLGRQPVKNYFAPRSLEESAKLSEVYEEERPYVWTEENRLFYTGCDLKKNGRVYGSYYYSLNNGNCRFYLLRLGREESPPPELGPRAIRGFLTPMDSRNYEAVTAEMAAAMGWTGERVAAHSSPYVIEVPDGVHRLRDGLTVLFLLGAALSLADLIWSSVCFLIPSMTPALWRLRRYGKIKSHLMQAEMEFKHGCQTHAGSLYLTTSYLISLSPGSAAVLPLSRLLWIYCQSQPRRFGGNKRGGSHTFHILVDDGKTWHFPCGTKEAPDEFISALKTALPELLTGYSEENKYAAKGRLKERLRKSKADAPSPG